MLVLTFTSSLVHLASVFLFPWQISSDTMRVDLRISKELPLFKFKNKSWITLFLEKLRNLMKVKILLHDEVKLGKACSHILVKNLYS